MANLNKEWGPQGAADFLDGPIRVLAGELLAVDLWGQLVALQTALRAAEVPWRYAAQVQQALTTWGTVGGVLSGMATTLATTTSEGVVAARLRTFGGVAQEKAQGIIDQADRRRVGDAGGLWGLWSSAKGTASQTFQLVGLPDPFDPQNALGGKKADEAEDLWRKWAWRLLWITGIGAGLYFVAPRLLEGGVAGYRRGGQPRQLPAPQQGDWEPAPRRGPTVIDRVRAARGGAARYDAQGDEEDCGCGG